MTTFTSDDREEAYKKINEDVVPIPFAGWVNTSPPHIVDSGASVMKDEPVAWMAINKSTGIGYVQKDKPTRMNKMDNEYTALYEQTPVAWLAIGENTNVFFDEETALSIDKNATPLYTHPAKELDEQFKKGFEAGKEEGWKAHKFHHPAKTLTDEEILTAIKEFAEEVMPYKEYENTYSDGWLDACNEIYSAVFAILRKAQEK